MIDDGAIPDEPDGETLDILSMCPEDVPMLTTMYAESSEAALREVGDGDLTSGIERTLARLRDRGLVRTYPPDAGVWDLTPAGRREAARRRAEREA